MNDKYTRPSGGATEQPAVLSLSSGEQIAYHKLKGESPGVIFLGGFRSNMNGTKATALHEHCRRTGRAFLRFDYQGHGQSSGEFTDGSIGQWSKDAIAALDQLTEGPQILIGSSMGGWIMLLVALARPQRVAGLIGVAAAPDFTEDLMWNRYGAEVRETLLEDGIYYEPSAYDDEPYPITLKLIEDGRTHLLLDRMIAIHCPVRLFHGMRDPDVPWMTAPQLTSKLLSDDIKVMLIKDGDHTLSREQDLARLFATLDELCETLNSFDAC